LLELLRNAKEGADTGGLCENVVIREDARKSIKIAEEMGEDAKKRAEKEIDELTKEFSDKVEKEFKNKSEEIMKI
jgi:ribosome recycling factor